MDTLIETIKQFVSVSYGDGYGYGDGNGNGYGYGYGNGDGDGYGNGDGDGYGNGYGYGNGNGYGYGNGDGNGDGYGYGSGIKEFDGDKLYIIDGVPTAIKSVHGNVAKGYTIRHNSIKVPCYVAKVCNWFGHGETAHEALQAATDKALANEPIEKRIERLTAEYPDVDVPIENSRLFVIHNRLTGSCEFGRREFAKTHDIDVENGQMTMREFINLTKAAYGHDSIEALAKEYHIKL